MKQWILDHEARRLGRPMSDAEFTILGMAEFSTSDPTQVYWEYRRLLRELKIEGKGPTTLPNPADGEVQ